VINPITYQLKRNGVVVSEGAFTKSNSGYKVYRPGNLPPGTYTYTLYLRDSRGGSSEEEIGTVIIQ